MVYRLTDRKTNKRIETRTRVLPVFTIFVGNPSNVAMLPDHDEHVMFLIFSLVGFFLILSVLTVSLVLATRAYKQSRKHRNRILTDWFQAEIAEFLFNRENMQEIPDDLTRIKKLGSRQLIIDEIVRLQSDLSGEVADQLKFLYESLDLQKDSLSKLNSPRWEIKTKGLKELSVMGVAEAISTIKKYTVSRNEILRGEAFLALVRMKSDDPLHFLDDDNIVLTPWDHINLQVAIQQSGKEIPEFKRWLTTSNESVLSFALKMASLHKQFDAEPEIKVLLDHANEKIRKEAIRALGNMEMPESSDLLKKRYSQEISQNRLAIIHSLGSIGNPEDIDFLTDVISANSDFDLLLASFKALYALDTKGREKINELSLSNPSKYSMYAMHVMDRRI
ncbi:MAG: hypothetical protein A2W90_17275 [Bacteroidetes bacterium GWF2_42_66]|nr:MAG: hypothetical protein A2W92_21490 [Bacteroidetes bacterium GWA2_42_15]OFX97651.1 MAG: hypothetical protein A2W89_19410 [Bacteroidetes bacterium GWE2_42_39]OFY46899.1 MAG: hypothetical protein A2W90_17275 [Bacteroidetes bacterium GWF2_42_66]HBL75743.1 hypothetical protein [Prolixibacteraceae bacterium]HCR92022.1 hypothetical protein [Prolixibacteraceae bacterium]